MKEEEIECLHRELLEENLWLGIKVLIKKIGIDVSKIIFSINLSGAIQLFSFLPPSQKHLHSA